MRVGKESVYREKNEKEKEEEDTLINISLMCATQTL